MFAHRSIRRLLVTLTICVGGAIAASAIAQDTTEPKKEPKPYPEGINCVWLPNLRSQYYSLIDDRHLVIEATRKKYYLLTLSRRCRDLDTTLDIGLETHGSQLCGPGDSIITDSDRCMIQYLEDVKNYDDAQQIVEDRDNAEKAARKKKDD